MTSQLAETIDHAAQPANTAPTLPQLLKQMEPEFARALPAHVGVDRFARMALTTVRQTPKLLECDPASVLGGLMSAAQLGLEVSSVRGQCYLIPRKNRGRMEATFQLGYRGLIDLAWRSGITVEVREVHDGEPFSVHLGTDARIDHTWRPDAGDVVAYYAVARFGDGRPSQFEVMTRDQVEEHRDRFASSAQGPWSDHFDAMARKTVIKRLLNPLPLSAEYAGAVATDDRAAYINLDDIGAGVDITVADEGPEDEPADA